MDLSSAVITSLSAFFGSYAGSRLIYKAEHEKTELARDIHNDELKKANEKKEEKDQEKRDWEKNAGVVEPYHR